MITKDVIWQLRCLSYQVLNTPGIPRGTEIAASNLLATTRLPRFSHRQLEADAADLKACLANSVVHRQEFEQVSRILIPARTSYKLGRLRGFAKSLIHRHVITVVQMAGLFTHWWLVLSMMVLAIVTAVVIVDPNQEWRQHSHYGAPFIAFCGLVLIGLSSIPITPRIERIASSISGTLIGIAAAFFIVLNAITPYTAETDKDITIVDAAKEPILLIVVAMLITIGLAVWITYGRRQVILNRP